MKVYVVEWGTGPDDWAVDSVWSTRELAERVAADCGPQHEVTEMELDPEDGPWGKYHTGRDE